MPCGRSAARSFSSMPGKVSWNRAIAAGRTACIQTGWALIRKQPARPETAASICSSAASSSRSTRCARSAARAPRDVRRTPDGMRSNSRPPKRASSRATVRESAGWEMASRSAAATIFPVSATARRLVRSVRLSNIAPLAVAQRTIPEFKSTDGSPNDRWITILTNDNASGGILKLAITGAGTGSTDLFYIAAFRARLTLHLGTDSFDGADATASGPAWSTTGTATPGPIPTGPAWCWRAPGPRCGRCRT